MKHLFAVVALGLAALSASAQDFQPVFPNAESVKITPETTKDTFKFENGTIKVSGKPNAYFYSDKNYKNFDLKYEWRYPEKAGNSGLLAYIQAPHKVWPKCIEVQGAYSGAGSIFAISGAKGKFTNDTAARKKALKPHQEWNLTEVTSRNGKLTAKVNGVVVSEGQADMLTEGQLGWQSEGAPIEYRNILIKVMD